LAFKPGNFNFWPIFAKIDDVTPYEKCEIGSKNKFPGMWWGLKA